jgi:hypothetical protein
MSNDTLILRIGQDNKIMLEVIVSVLNKNATDKIKQKLCNIGNNSDITKTALILNGLSIPQLSKCVNASNLVLEWDFQTEIIVLFKQMNINNDSHQTRKYAGAIREQYKKAKMITNTPYNHQTPCEITNAII